MSRVRRTWQVENTWNCPSCSALNRGRDLNCRNCGARKDGKVRDNAPDPTNEVKDPELLRKATAGANWKCEFCGGQERNPEGKCSNCAGPKPSTALPDDEPKPVPPKTKPAKPVEPARLFPTERAYKLIEELDRARTPVWARKTLVFGLRIWHLAGIVAGVALLVWLLVWLLTPRVVTAKVTDISWNYTVHLRERVTRQGEEWGRPGGKGFYSEPAFNVRCYRRYYGEKRCNPRDCNPHSVSYECNCTSYDCNCLTSCSDNGNGFSTCSEVCSTCQSCQTCSRTEYDTCWDSCPVYKDWCVYDYYDWPVIKTKTDGGKDHAVRWPELLPDGSLQRIQKIEKYHVGFRADEEIFEYAPKSLTDYRRFNVGDSWRLKVGRVRGKVEALTKLSAEKE